MKKKLQERAKELCDLWGMNDRHGYGAKETFEVGFVQGANYQRETTIKQAIEACKQTCPSKVSKGCASILHKREMKTTRCDGNCARVRYFVNAINKQEV